MSKYGGVIDLIREVLHANSDTLGAARRDYDPRFAIRGQRTMSEPTHNVTAIPAHVLERIRAEVRAQIEAETNFMRAPPPSYAGFHAIGQGGAQAGMPVPRRESLLDAMQKRAESLANRIEDAGQRLGVFNDTRLGPTPETPQGLPIAPQRVALAGAVLDLLEKCHRMQDALEHQLDRINEL